MNGVIYNYKIARPRELRAPAEMRGYTADQASELCSARVLHYSGGRRL